MQRISNGNFQNFTENLCFKGVARSQALPPSQTCHVSLAQLLIAGWWKDGGVRQDHCRKNCIVLTGTPCLMQHYLKENKLEILTNMKVLQNSESKKRETLCKTWMKTECNALQMLFDLYSFEYGTNTRYLMFKLINFGGFIKYTLHFTQHPNFFLVWGLCKTVQLYLNTSDWCMYECILIIELDNASQNINSYSIFSFCSTEINEHLPQSSSLERHLVCWFSLRIVPTCQLMNGLHCSF